MILVKGLVKLSIIGFGGNCGFVFGENCSFGGSWGFIELISEGPTGGGGE